MSTGGTRMTGRKKRPRAGPDQSLIIDEPRKRKRREGSTEAAGGGSTFAFATVRARTQDEFEEVKQKGLVLYDRLLAQVDPADSRPLWPAFAELPDHGDYPDYYEQIKNPISLSQIKAKLDSLAYGTLSDLRTELGQMFWNAQKYNAKGSAIFLDTKRLKKTLKETYGVLTGEAPAADDDDGPTSAHPTSDTAGDSSPLTAWLKTKLAETMRVADSDGRLLVDFFRVVPDKKLYPDYYRVIPNPMAFDMINSRLNKRVYQGPEQFMADVNKIFDNAMYYNQEGSMIWQDASALKERFAEIMTEAPPDSGLDGNRRGSSAAIEDDYGSEYGDGAQLPLDILAPKLEDTLDSFSLIGASPSLTPAAASPAAFSSSYTPTTSTTGLPTLSTIPEAAGVNNPLSGLAALAGFSPDAASSPAALNGLGSVSRPATSRASSDGIFHPRLVVKLPAIGEIPLITSFTVTSTPLSLPPLNIDNSTIHQHSFSIPSSTETLTFTPIFRSSSDFGSSTGALGKGKAAAPFEAQPTVAIKAKPASVPFKHAVAAVGEGQQQAYELQPTKGLNIVEFVVRPANGQEGDGSEEVYRCFVTK
ncbi:hypothetical protein JCM11641_000477 [Rhodosporidiobolus odoratus]